MLEKLGRWASALKIDASVEYLEVYIGDIPAPQRAIHGVLSTAEGTGGSRHSNDLKRATRRPARSSGVMEQNLRLRSGAIRPSSGVPSFYRLDITKVMLIPR